MVINTGYVSYPDEFVNLLGGKYILAGKLPYRDFFDHHLPLAWYLSAPMLLISSQSFVIFRLLWAVAAFSILFGVGLYIRQEHREIGHLYWIFLLLYPFFALYYWLHLYLADSLALIFFSSAFWLLLSQTYAPRKNFRTVVFAGVMVWALVFSSLTYLYLALGLYAWLGYLTWKEWGIKKVMYLAGLCLSPYILYGMYLFVSGTFQDFWTANFTYNSELYLSLPNYTRGTHFNPFKFVLTLIFNFHQTYWKQVVAIKEFDIYFPVATMLAWSTFAFLALLFFENKILALLFFFILSVSAPRSDVSDIDETNYQIAVYLGLGLISALVSLWRVKQLKFQDELYEIFRKLATFFVALYLIFASIFLIKNTYDKTFQRYTQFLPSIGEIKDFANFTQDIFPGEQRIYWDGPYEPTDLFYISVDQLPGKYISLLPQFRENTYFASTFIDQFEKSKPAMIIYLHRASIFNTPADEFGAFFLTWMKGKYVTIDSLQKYKILKSPTNFGVGGDLYFRADLESRVIQTLLEKGYIIER